MSPLPLGRVVISDFGAGDRPNPPSWATDSGWRPKVYQNRESGPGGYGRGFAAMELTTILNRCHHFRGFVRVPAETHTQNRDAGAPRAQAPRPSTRIKNCPPQHERPNPKHEEILGHSPQHGTHQGKDPQSGVFVFDVECFRGAHRSLTIGQ